VELDVLRRPDDSLELVIPPNPADVFVVRAHTACVMSLVIGCAMIIHQLPGWGSTVGGVLAVIGGPLGYVFARATSVDRATVPLRFVFQPDGMIEVSRVSGRRLLSGARNGVGILLQRKSKRGPGRIVWSRRNAQANLSEASFEILQRYGLILERTRPEEIRVVLSRDEKKWIVFDILIHTSPWWFVLYQVLSAGGG
jgi:hypothetical protein